MNDQRREDLISFLSKLGLEESSLDLTDQALTHSSFAFENELPYNNERLEFLGDAVVEFYVSRYLYENFPDATEGELSKLRAGVVNRRYLGDRAKQIGLGSLLLLGKGEEQTGGRERRSSLGSALEALIGAIFLSSGIEVTGKFIKKVIIEPASELLHAGVDRDYKSQLQELVQRQLHFLPYYRTVNEEGPDHKKTFVVEVYINGQCYGQGFGSKKKSAENEAARNALQKLRSELKDQD